MELKLNNKSIIRMHKIIKRTSSMRFSTVLAFFTGAIVSLVEFPCTGQIYIPIILLIKEQALKGYFYLFLYNIFFILPLILLFLIIYLGINISKIIKFYSKNIVAMKIAFSGFFLILFLIYFISF